MKIEFHSVTKVFGKKAAVQDLTFTLKPGEIVGFVGPNGAGKTTTMRLMLGFISPETGTIVYDGVLQEEAIPEVRSKFGYLPENNPLPEEMLVADYLEFHARSRGLKDEYRRIKKIAEELDFADYLVQPIGSLSKGYRQRVGIAAAMISDPDVLVLDEPQEGLDPAQRLEIRNLIRRAGKEKTVVLSTHILNEVVETCNRVILINDGRIVLDDTVENAIKKFSATSFIVTVRGRDALPLVKKEFGENLVELIKSEGEELRLKVWAEKDIREELFRFCVKNDLVLLELAREEATLEDVFLQLTERQRD